VKTIASGLVTHMMSEVLTLNVCILITRTDGAKFGYTDCDFDLVVSGQTYKALTGASATQNDGSAAMNVDHAEVLSYLDASEMTEADLMAGKWDDATISMFMVNRKNVSSGTYHMRDGVLGQITVKSPSEFQAELRGLTQFLQKQIGEVITPLCRWDLGSTSQNGPPGARGLCTVNLTPYTITGVAVTAVSTNQNFTASSLTQAVAYFQAGKVTWTSGLNNGRSMDIQAHGSGGVLVLALPMLNNVQIGDVFTIVPGCQKRLVQDCIGKFNNGINHGGFPYLPGIDKMMRPGGV
jgi:uncharacterized phage protein (TIGR02218 family)